MALYPRAVSAKRYPVRSAKRSKKVRYLKPGPYAPKSIVQGFNSRSGVFGFPVSLRTKLRYVENISMSSASGAMANNVFRANSLFDPNETGTGHQPMCFDQWMTLYNHFMVIGSKITVHFAGDGGTSGVPLIYGVALTDDATSTSSPGTIMENGTTKYRVTGASANYTQKTAPRISKGFSCKKFFNITNPLDNVLRLGGNVAADPTEIAFFSVFLGCLPDTATDIGATQLTVVIDYLTIFSEPKEQAQS